MDEFNQSNSSASVIDDSEADPTYSSMDSSSDSENIPDVSSVTYIFLFHEKHVNYST